MKDIRKGRWRERESVFPYGFRGGGKTLSSKNTNGGSFNGFISGWGMDGKGHSSLCQQVLSVLG